MSGPRNCKFGGEQVQWGNHIFTSPENNPISDPFSENVDLIASSIKRSDFMICWYSYLDSREGSGYFSYVTWAFDSGLCTKVSTTQSFLSWHCKHGISSFILTARFMVRQIWHVYCDCPSATCFLCVLFWSVVRVAIMGFMYASLFYFFIFIFFSFLCVCVCVCAQRKIKESFEEK